MLREHQVGLLTRRGAPAEAEAVAELDAPLGVVLAERRIGDHPVEAHQAPVLDVLRFEQRVAVPDVGVRDAVQQQVHPADRPDGPIVFLAIEAQARPAMLQGVFISLVQHAATAASGIVKRRAALRVEDPHHELHDPSRGVELAGFLAGRIERTR